MIMVLVAIALGAILFDVLLSRQRPHVALRGTHHVVTLATIVAIVGFFLTVITTGESLLSTDKLLLLENLNRWHIIWTTGASVGAVLAYARKRWQPFAVCVLLLLVDMYVGFRVAFATTILAIFTLALTGAGDQRLALNNWKACLLGVFSALSLMVYKFLFIAIKMGSWDLVAQDLASPDFYLLSITQSEPFTTQVILNTV